MRIHVLSDLHLEFSPFAPQVTAADVVILAGDIHVKGRGVPWARQAFEGPVLYVPFTAATFLTRWLRCVLRLIRECVCSNGMTW